MTAITTFNNKKIKVKVLKPFGSFGSNEQVFRCKIKKGKHKGYIIVRSKSALC